MRIGDGEIGGKARGLAAVREILDADTRTRCSADLDIRIPRLVVICTGVFEAFMERNRLYDIAMSDLPNERIAHAFQRASLPTEITGDLTALMDEVHEPLAIRSSSLLEDALFRPFAGVYETKMTPNNQPEPAERFRKLVEAIKFVWSSTFFKMPRQYIRTTGKSIREERMAVVIQEVVGNRYGERFYPPVSGVCRSYNFYPMSGARPEEGVVSLALGLGKTIVDGGVCWSYSPPRPKNPPPFSSVHDEVNRTQTRFWAVNMGRPPVFDPIAETEYIVESNVVDAERDGALDWVASTYDSLEERLVPGTRESGPRVITFAPILEYRVFDLNETVRRLMAVCERVLGRPVEIEFAVSPSNGDDGARPTLGFLQVRPMVAPTTEVEVTDADLSKGDLLAASSQVLGNGVEEQVRDVVYIRPGSFDAGRTQEIADELEELDRQLQHDDRKYLLIAVGRLGTSDPWLGIPVDWSQISGARAIIEATLPAMDVELSQGSHFFHNLSSFEVSYFMIPRRARPGIDWAWLDQQPLVAETAHVRHVRLHAPLHIRVDGRSGRGVIRKPDPPPAPA
ncbi:MAG: PEP/pyruvate-binding domain-containing protein [Planctomycetota bacterium]